MKSLKLGDKGSAVKRLQEILKLKVDGYFGLKTRDAVIRFQKSKKLKADGIVGPETCAALGLVIEDLISTDLSNSSVSLEDDSTNSLDSISTIHNNIVINKFYLDKNEYVNDKTVKEWLILHHTAGGHDPYRTIKIWNNDQRGRIATQFVIGSVSITNGDDKMDGLIVECFEDGNWAYHLGNNGNKNLHPMSVGIEVCNYGWLEKGKDGKFRNYVGGIVPDSMVCDLGFKFRGKQFYHAYTDKQIHALYQLILEIKRRNPKIDLKSGLSFWLKKETALQAFEYKEDAFKGRVKGILSHSNIRSDKSDVYPHPKLVEMLKSL